MGDRVKQSICFFRYPLFMLLKAVKNYQREREREREAEAEAEGKGEGEGEGEGVPCFEI